MTASRGGRNQASRFACAHGGAVLLTGEITSIWRLGLGHLFPELGNGENAPQRAHFHILTVNYPASQLLDVDSLADRIPRSVQERLTAGAAHLILSAPREGHRFDGRFGRAFDGLAKKLNCRHRQIVFLTQNSLYDARYRAWCQEQGIESSRRIKVLFHNSPLLRMAFEGDDLGTFSNEGPVRPRKFLFLNNIPRAHRLFLFKEVADHGLLTEGLVSFNFRARDAWEHSMFGVPLLDDLRVFYPRLGRRQIRQLCDHLDGTYLPLRLDLTDRDQLSDQGRPCSPTAVPWELFQQSYFSLVAETEMDSGDDLRRFTEKSLKPLLGMHPFLVAGQPGTLAALRELGFRTFGSHIDEHYDEVEDAYQRAQLVFQQVRRLCQMSPEVLHDWFCELQPVLIHNQRHFVHHMPRWWKRRFLKLCATIVSVDSLDS